MNPTSFESTEAMSGPCRSFSIYFDLLTDLLPLARTTPARGTCGMARFTRCARPRSVGLATLVRNIRAPRACQRTKSQRSLDTPALSAIDATTKSDGISDAALSAFRAFAVTRTRRLSAILDYCRPRTRTGLQMRPRCNVWRPPTFARSRCRARSGRTN